MPDGVELATAYVTVKADGSRVPAESATLGARAGQAFGKGFGKSTLTTEKAVERIGKASKRVFLVGAAGIAIAEKKAADYNAQMATVFTLAHANTRQQAQLSKAAQTVGVNIGYSATKAGAAEEELVKAGVSVRDMLTGGLKGALDLAAAGQTDVGTATEVAASAMTQFKLKGKDVPHIADLLAAGADKALGSVTDLGYGLGQVGTVAHQMNLSIEDTTGTLAEFAQNGLLGERGGAAFKQMLLRLANPTKKSADLMDQYGLSLYDANGQMKSMPEIAGALQKSFKDLTPAQRNAALGTIFGSRAIQAANILVKDGEKVNRRWIKSVDDQGFAAHQASGKMNSLKGDAQKLNAELENAFIKASGKQSFLRILAQDATKVLKGYNKLSDAQRELINGAIVKVTEGAGIIWAATKVYKLAKATSELYGWATGRGAVSKLGGATGASGVIGTRVFVTNWPPGFGVGGAKGGAPVVAGETKKAGAGASAVGVGENVAKRGKLLGAAVAGGVAGIEAYMTLEVNKMAQDALGKIGSKGHQKGIFSQFEKPRSKKDQLIFGGSASHTVKHDTKAALGALKFPALTKIEQKITGPFGGDGLTKSIKNVKTLDTALAQLTFRKPNAGAAAFNDIMQKSGLSTDQLNKVLPKTADIMDATHGAAKTLGDTLLGTADGTRKTGLAAKASMYDFTGYSKVLHKLPKGVQTKISSPGFIPTSANVKKLNKQYDLTPKQLHTLVKLLGGPQAISEANRVQHRLDALNGKTIHTYIRNITTHENQGGGAGPKKDLGGLFAVPRKKRAGGGRVMAGYPYEVGEIRRETFIPDQNGRVVANPALGGGAVSLSINGPVRLVMEDGREMNAWFEDRYDAEVSLGNN